MALSEKQNKEYFRIAVMIPTISILSAYEGWYKILAVGILLILSLVFKRLTPKLPDEKLNVEADLQS